ncbi:MAG: hypothetical protein ACLUUO_09100 [Sellimonas intestinalis]
MQKEDYLFTISFAYINFARMEHHFFGALFVNPLLDSRTVREVIDSPWNRETIKCTAEQFGISIRESEELYMGYPVLCPWNCHAALWRELRRSARRRSRDFYIMR